MEDKLDAKLDARFEKMGEKLQKDLQVGIQQGLASITAKLSNLIRQATQPSIETNSGKKVFEVINTGSQDKVQHSVASAFEINASPAHGSKVYMTYSLIRWPLFLIL